jgi:hypothetical protein
MLRAALRLADGRGLALDRQTGGERVGWAVYATADFDHGEPERLRNATVAEAVDLAPEERELIVTATLDAVAASRLPDGAGQPDSEVVPPQSERLVDELVETGLPRDTVLSLTRRLSRAHVVARDLQSPPARETSERDAHLESEEQLHAVPMRARRRRWPSRAPRLAVAAVATGALVLVAVVGLLIFGPSEGSRSKRQSASTQPSSSAASVPTRRRPARNAYPAGRAPAPTVPLSLSAIGAWDPYGDGREHGTKAAAAEDGNPGTYWPTETYVDGLQKPGVGLVLDLGRAVHLRRLVVTTDTPGYTALIEAGSTSAGPFKPISRARAVGSTTAFSLRARAERYYLIWIRSLDHTAHVNEVHAFGY